jgi:hypothetical protein
MVIESTATFRSRRQTPLSSGPEKEEEEDEWEWDEDEEGQGSTSTSSTAFSRSQYVHAAFAPPVSLSPSPALTRAAQRMLTRLGMPSEKWRQADAEAKRDLIAAMTDDLSSAPPQQQEGNDEEEGRAETALAALLQLGVRWDSLPTRPRNKLALALARSLAVESDACRRRAAALSMGLGMRREVVPKQLRPLCLLGESLVGSAE